MAGSNAGSSGGPNTIGLVGNFIAKPLNSGYSFIYSVCASTSTPIYFCKRLPDQIPSLVILA